MVTPVTRPSPQPNRSTVPAFQQPPLTFNIPTRDPPQMGEIVISVTKVMVINQGKQSMGKLMSWVPWESGRVSGHGGKQGLIYCSFMWTCQYPEWRLSVENHADNLKLNHEVYTDHLLSTNVTYDTKYSVC